MQFLSSAFKSNQAIPPKYTYDGNDVSPPLEWANLPEKCKSLAIICEDQDVTSVKGRDFPFVHWLIYNISPGTASLPEGIVPAPAPNFPDGAMQGKNSFGKIGYSGPMPPEGAAPHRYVFSLYALRKDLELDAGLTKSALIDEMRGEILEIARLTGTYQRVALRAG